MSAQPETEPLYEPVLFRIRSRKLTQAGLIEFITAIPRLTASWISADYVTRHTKAQVAEKVAQAFEEAGYVVLVPQGQTLHQEKAG